MIKFQTEIDYIDCGMSLLIHLGKDEPYRASTERVAKKILLNLPVLLKENQKKLSLLTRIEKKAQKELHNEMEEIRWYFSPIDEREDSDTLGRVLLLWDEFKITDPVPFEEFSQKRLSMDRNSFNQAFSYSIQGLTDHIRNSELFVNLEDSLEIISFIMKMNLPLESRWKLQELFIDYQKHMTKVLSLLEQTIGVLKGFEEELKELIREFEGYWSEQIGEGDFTDFLESCGVGSLTPNPFGAIIQPKLFTPLMVGLHCSMDDQTRDYNAPFLASIGIFYSRTNPPFRQFGPEEETGNAEFYMDALKLLSDKSKFQILSYIKDKTAYGNELANHLGLSTATVSHHMSLLQTNHLVRINQEGNRFYYSSNKELLEKCLDYYRKMLL